MFGLKQKKIIFENQYIGDVNSYSGGVASKKKFHTKVKTQRIAVYYDGDVKFIRTGGLIASNY